MNNEAYFMKNSYTKKYYWGYCYAQVILLISIFFQWILLRVLSIGKPKLNTQELLSYWIISMLAAHEGFSLDFLDLISNDSLFYSRSANHYQGRT